MSMTWAKRRSLTLALALLTACGGDDGSSPAPMNPVATPTPAAPQIPADAKALESQLAGQISRTMSRLATAESGTVIALNPGMPLAPGMTVTPGSAPGAFSFKGVYEALGNGLAQTTIDGTLTFTNDPTDFAAGFNGANGTASVSVDLLGGLMRMYRSNLTFTMGMAEHRVSGSGSFSDPLSGVTTTMAVATAEPLGIKVADGTASARPNACTHSLNGPAQFSLAGPLGTLSSQWHFAYDRSTVTVSGASYTDKGGQTTSLPDTEVDLGCGTSRSLSDWNGRFRIQWACLPLEFGEFFTTIAVKNATTVTMTDDGDTPDEAYDASMIGSSPRAIRGFFQSGPSGSRYREDFNWALNADASGFSQTSRYVYFEGPQQGRGGLCAARATRV